MENKTIIRYIKSKWPELRYIKSKWPELKFDRKSSSLVCCFYYGKYTILYNYEVFNECYVYEDWFFVKGENTIYSGEPHKILEKDLDTEINGAIKNLKKALKEKYVFCKTQLKEKIEEL